MKRTLLALSIALAACGDDAPSDDDSNAPGEKDSGREDATLPRSDAAAPGLLDASMEASAPDAEVIADAAVVDAASFDAAQPDTGTDAGSDAGADASECAAEGERCDNGDSCCTGTLCVTSSAAPYKYCAASCDQDTDCESGCCTDLDDSAGERVCAPQPYCEEEPDPTAPLTGISCYMRLGVYDNTGGYMGKATSSPFEADSVCNNSGQYGKYGTNPNKMWSIVSDAYSTILPFSAVIGCDGDFPILAYVSKYKGESNVRVIDPDYLCQVLDNSNL